LEKKKMKKSTKITLVAFVILVVAVIPLYYFTRPDATQPAGTLQIKGRLTNPANLTYAQLAAYPAVSMQITINGHQGGNGNFTYTGVTLKELLTQAGTSSNATSVYIQASDGYGTTLTIQEATKSNVFIAYQKEGATMTALKYGGEGPFRLVIASDEFSQRSVRGVVAIEVS
jgi:DMSO/TMAO reductase YedYZ molybdopterin-dependent catalytic subunit